MKKTTSHLSVHNYIHDEKLYRVVRYRHKPTAAPGGVAGLAVPWPNVANTDAHYYDAPADVHIWKLPSMRVLSRHTTKPGEWHRFLGLTGNRYVKVGAYVYNLGIVNLLMSQYNALAYAPIDPDCAVVQFPGGAEALELVTTNERIYVARCLYAPRRTLRLVEV